MRIINIEIKNFLSIENINTSLDRPGLNLVLGENKDNPAFSNNGSGKSSFFEAIIWGLFGEIVRDVSIDDIVRKGQKELYVGLVVDPENGEAPVVVSRYRSDKKTHFYVREMEGDNSELFPAASVKEKQKLLDAWLGIDYNTFINSVYFGKGLTKFFMTSNDNDRKDVLESILQLISFDKPFEKAKDALKLLLIEEDRINGEIAYYKKWAVERENQLSKSISEKDRLVKQNPEMDAAVEKITKIINKVGLLKLDIDKADVGVTRLVNEESSILEEIEAVFKKSSEEIIEDYNKNINSLNSLEKEEKDKINLDFKDQEVNCLSEYNEVNRLYKEALQKNDFYRDALVVSRSDLNRLNEELRKVKSNTAGTTCPTCFSLVSEDHIASVVAELEGKIQKKETEVNGLIETSSNITSTTINPLFEMLSSLEKDKEELIKQKNASLLELSQKYSKRRNALLEKKSNDEKQLLKEKAARVKELSSVLSTQLAELRSIIYEKNLEIKDLEYNRVVLKNSVENHAKALKTINETIENDARLKQESLEKAKNFQSLLEKLKAEKPLLEFAVDAFSPKGIRSLIFENALPYITERANYYSMYLTGGTVKIDISPTTTTKTTKETKEKLSVSARNALGSEIYSGNSDGERRRIDVCILLALQDLIGTRSTKIWNLAIYDEIADALDATGIQNLIDLFRSIASEKSVYIISHSTDMKQYFDECLLFIKEGGVSRLSYGS